MEKDREPNFNKRYTLLHGKGLVKLANDFKAVDNGTEWGPEIPLEEAKKRFHDVQTLSCTETNLAAQIKLRKEGGESVLFGTAAKPYPAMAFFEWVDVEDVGKVSIGDYIEVDSGDTWEGSMHHWVCQVTCLFQDIAGQRYVLGFWFYHLSDTIMRIEKKGEDPRLPPIELDPNMLFKASVTDNDTWRCVNLLDTINRKVTVVHVAEGVEEAPKDCDYYWRMVYDRRNYSFAYSFSEQRPSKEKWAGKQRVIRALDLYSGCGGLSFIDNETEHVCIRTDWAVDFKADMCASFKANYPNTEVFNMGVDVFLMKAIFFQKLYRQYVPAYEQAESPCEREWGWRTVVVEEAMPQKSSGGAGRGGGKGSKKGGRGGKGNQAGRGKSNSKPRGGPKQDRLQVEKIEGMKLEHSAEVGTKGQEKGNLLRPLTEEDCKLLLYVRWVGQAEPTWEPVDSLRDAPWALGKFLFETRQSGRMPLPGDVNLVMGGPPCQGVSGLNRHAKQDDILNDSRNRQGGTFFDVISFFRPEYVLMENVVDILKKEDGSYAKCGAAQLLAINYQCRMGIIAAGDHGVPQGRLRVFMWGAAPGEQLPAFPEPTHRMECNLALPRSGHWCRVEFLSDENKKNALPPVLMGDMLSDLPEVNNFCATETQMYKSDPRRPFQIYIRREPPPGQASREQRIKSARACMDNDWQDDLRQLKGIATTGNAQKAGAGTVELGKKYFNTKRGNNGFAAESLKEGHEEKANCFKDEGAAKQEAVKAGNHGLVGSNSIGEAWIIGRQVEREVDKALQPVDVSKAVLRDHRPLTVNVDDYLRMCAVPKRKGANFRQFGGVVEHKDGSANAHVCAGHSHPKHDGRGVNLVCPGHGEGFFMYPKCSTGKEGRVDFAEKEGWRGTFRAGCPARTVWLSSGDLLCPRWCITYKKGKSNGRHGCFGRIWHDAVQPTVVGRAEPHNLALIHPEQNRVLTIRENMRCQGFPDYFVLVGLPSGQDRWVRHASLVERYQQVGNAVCPLVAAALGRCLQLAAVGESPLGEQPCAFIISTADPEVMKAHQMAQEQGLVPYADELRLGNVVLDEAECVENDDDDDQDDQSEGAAGGKQRGQGKGGKKGKRGSKRGTQRGGGSVSGVAEEEEGEVDMMDVESRKPKGKKVKRGRFRHD